MIMSMIFILIVIEFYDYFCYECGRISWRSVIPNVFNRESWQDVIPDVFNRESRKDLGQKRGGILMARRLLNQTSTRDRHKQA